jgi:hypothetical protein
MRAHVVDVYELKTAKHSGSSVLQSYQYSLLLIIFCSYLNEIGDNMGPTTKSKVNVIIGFVNQQIINKGCFIESLIVY